MLHEVGCVGPGAQLGSPLRDSVIAEPFWSLVWGAQPSPAPCSQDGADGE